MALRLDINDTDAMKTQTAHATPLDRWAAMPLSFVLSGIEPKDCKLHCAVWNGAEQPLEVFARSWEAWVGWNRWRPNTNDFNRRYVVSLMQVYTERDKWIFGGLFEVVGTTNVPGPNGYDVKLVDHPIQAWVGRLKVHFHLTGRQVRRSLETVINNITIAEVLPVRYAGQPFPGADRIEHGFRELAVVYQQQRADWRVALEHLKGVYVLHDKHTGKSYVGSACGDTGVWARWGQYLATGHGGNVDLRALVEKKGIEYIREHFTFALLEYWAAARTPDEYVLEREGYWKRVLLSREFGYNAN